MSPLDFLKRVKTRKPAVGTTHAENSNNFSSQYFAADYKIHIGAYGVSSPNLLKIEILNGPLQNTTLDIEQEITNCRMSLYLKIRDETIGRSLIDRNPKSGEIIYWDIMVKPQYRMKGLASLMTKYSLRELLLQQRKVKFMIRMIKIFRPTDTAIKLQNLGICVIAHRLGLACEFDLPKLLDPSNIVNMEIISPETDPEHPQVMMPPAYKIDLKTYPYVLIGFIIDPETKKPIINYDTYIQMIRKPEDLDKWIKMNAIVIGNGNYVLRKDGFDCFIKCIAHDSYEAEVFRKKLQEF